MGKLRKKKLGHIICFITGLITGILIGIVILSILVSYRMDEHYKRIISLENIIQDKDTKLEKLEKSIRTRNSILQNIEVNLIFDGDEMDKIDIEKAIKEKYITLLGKEVKSIDSDILVEVVDKRILKLEKKEYKLRVEKLILTETLKIYVKVEVIDS